jgi:hypothetical protein
MRHVIAVIAAGICFLLALSGGSQATRIGVEAKGTETRSLARGGVRSLRVETRNGAVRVAGAAASVGDQLVIQATKRVRAGERRQAEAFLRQVTIRSQRQGDRWTVAARWPDPLPQQIQSVGVSLDLRIPRGMELEAVTRNGPIEASEVGPCRLRTSNGPIQARHVSGGVNAETSNGPIYTEACAGPVVASTSNGPIRIREAGDSVKASTSNGPVGVGVTDARGAVQAVQIEVQTSSAPIDVLLPERVAARVDAATSGARIHIDPPLMGARYNADQTRLEAVLGEGRGLVHLRTSNGPIRIRSAAPQK